MTLIGRVGQLSALADTAASRSTRPRAAVNGRSDNTTTYELYKTRPSRTRRNPRGLLLRRKEVIAAFASAETGRPIGRSWHGTGGREGRGGRVAMPKKRRPEAGTELLVRYGFSRLGCQHSRGGRAAAADRTRAMQQVKYRLVNPGLAPRRTKLEMPGWAGQPDMPGIAHRSPKACSTASKFSIPTTMSFGSAAKTARWSLTAISGRLLTTAATGCGRRFAALGRIITLTSCCSI